jgi:hypothetical protein
MREVIIIYETLMRNEHLPIAASVIAITIETYKEDGRAYDSSTTVNCTMIWDQYLIGPSPRIHIYESIHSTRK